MRFDTNRLNEISIFDVAAKLGIVVKRNKAKCFMHEEKTASLSFNKKGNYWNCFSCGKGGGSIELVKKKTGLEFSDACQWLMNEFNLIGTKRSQISIRKITKNNLKAPNPVMSSKCQRNITVYEWIINHSVLTTAAKKFLFNQRKYPEELISKLQIRSVDDTKLLYQQCINAFGFERLIKCGLVKEQINTHGEGFLGFIWWQPMILIPYFNLSGEVISIQARNLDSSSKYRYINLSMIETCIFNLQIINELSEGQQLIICEGVTDCISSLAMGKPAIGIPGAAGFKKEYVQLLKSFKLIVVPDNDSAGQLFEKRIKNLFMQNGKEIFVSLLEKRYKDLSEFYIQKYCKS